MQLKPLNLEPLSSLKQNKPEKEVPQVEKEDHKGLTVFHTTHIPILTPSSLVFAEINMSKQEQTNPTNSKAKGYTKYTTWQTNGTENPRKL